jgi:hypothetical protein
MSTIFGRNNIYMGDRTHIRQFRFIPKSPIPLREREKFLKKHADIVSAHTWFFFSIKYFKYVSKYLKYLSIKVIEI